jgi:site-specific DNA-cytosine methylase
MRTESSAVSDGQVRVAKKVKSSEVDDIVKPKAMDLSYVEFYSGIGGWTMALEEAIERIPEVEFSLRRIAALDHSDLCTRVFEHNFGSDSQPKSFSIQRLTQRQVEEWNAVIWAMRPPCQPHTRQHSNQEEDLDVAPWSGQRTVGC